MLGCLREQLSSHPLLFVESREVAEELEIAFTARMRKLAKGGEPHLMRPQLLKLCFLSCRV